MPRDALFDLAVNRALSYTQRLKVSLHDADTLRSKLEVWYLKTRFAYRIPLDDVVATLLGFPGADHYWQGGSEGRWQEGKVPNP